MLGYLVDEKCLEGPPTVPYPDIWFRSGRFEKILETCLLNLGESVVKKSSLLLNDPCAPYYKDTGFGEEFV